MQGPTIAQFANADAKNDAEKLHGTIKRLGADTGVVTSILCARSNSQRQEIARCYMGLYQKDLKNELGSHLFGEFKQLVVALMETPAEFDAKNLHHAIKHHVGCVLMEILCTRTNSQIAAIRDAYQHLFKIELKKDIHAHSKIHARRLLEQLVDGERGENAPVDKEAAEERKIIRFNTRKNPISGGPHARLLWHEKTHQQPLHNGALYEIMASNSFAQLKEIFNIYERLSGQRADELVPKEFAANDGGVCLNSAVKAIRNPLDFFAEALHKCFD
ncbi:Annexin A7, partial [Aphelenchoides avenae]